MKNRVIPLFAALALGVSAVAVSESLKGREDSQEAELSPAPVKAVHHKTRKDLERKVTRRKSKIKRARQIKKDLNASGIENFDDLCEDMEIFPEYYQREGATLVAKLLCAKLASAPGYEIVEADESESEECAAGANCTVNVKGEFDIISSDFLIDDECPVSDQFCSSVDFDGHKVSCELDIKCSFDPSAWYGYDCSYNASIDGMDVSYFHSLPNNNPLADIPDPAQICMDLVEEYVNSPFSICTDDEFSVDDCDFEKDPCDDLPSFDEILACRNYDYEEAEIGFDDDDSSL